jgi:hypothetical protein
MVGVRCGLVGGGEESQGSRLAMEGWRTAVEGWGSAMEDVGVGD